MSNVSKVIYNGETLIDLTEDTVEAGKMLSGTTAHDKAGEVIVGTIVNVGSENEIIEQKAQEITIVAGLHDGSGKVKISPVEQDKIIPGNIKDGVTVLGVTGDYVGRTPITQAKTATPYTTAQIVAPDTGYEYLSQVSVDAIAYNLVNNADGGQTCTIGTVAPT